MAGDAAEGDGEAVSEPREEDAKPRAGAPFTQEPLPLAFRLFMHPQILAAWRRSPRCAGCAGVISCPFRLPPVARLTGVSRAFYHRSWIALTFLAGRPHEVPAASPRTERAMYAVMLMTALAAPGQLPGWCGWGCGPYGGSYAHGYGLFRPLAPSDAGGPGVLPPSWASDSTAPCEGKARFDYLMELDSHERDDMVRVWERATPEARRKLLAKLPGMIGEAAIYRDQVARERALERFKVENRPLSDEEVAAFDAYYATLRGLRRKFARDHQVRHQQPRPGACTSKRSSANWKPRNSKGRQAGSGRRERNPG